jgi:hypothetical protein
MCSSSLVDRVATFLLTSVIEAMTSRLELVLGHHVVHGVLEQVLGDDLIAHGRVCGGFSGGDEGGGLWLVEQDVGEQMGIRRKETGGGQTQEGR